MTTIFLGFEKGSVKPVSVPLHHLIITGMTRLSGKTTTLEALVSRSGMKAITFRTKRGELGFEEAHPLPLYFDERGLTHWKALEGLIEATLEEKVRREPGVRAQIIRVCEDAESLSTIYDRIKEKAEDPKVRGFVKDVLVKLHAYLELVMPQIRRLDLVDTLKLEEGANVMDLEGLSDEMQNLILYGVIKHIYEKERDTVIVMPEAWKFIPQDRGSPCKPIVEKFIREGAAIGNYLWIDSQDLRGVDKKYTRQIDNWILGRQRDEREVAATLKALPLPKKLKPKEEEIMTLDLGHFIACLHNDVYKVYVQPKWLPDEPAKRIALGELRVEDAVKAMPVLEVDDPLWKERYEKEVPVLKAKVKELLKALEDVSREKEDLKVEVEACSDMEAKIQDLQGERDNLVKELNALQRRLKAYSSLDEFLCSRIQELMPAGFKPATIEGETEVSVRRTVTEFDVSVERAVVEASDKDLKGQILLSAIDGFLEDRQRISNIRRELKRRFNASPRPGTLESLLAELVALGVFDRERTPQGGWVYWFKPEAKERVKLS